MQRISYPLWTITKLATVSVLLLLLSSCGSGDDMLTDPPMPVSIYMPSVPGYQTSPVEGSVAGALDTLGIDLGTITGVVIEFLDEVLVCLADRGVLDVRLYVNTSNPTDVGMVGLVRRNGLTSNALSCVADVLGDGRVIDPCADAGSFQVDGSNILFGYSGLNPQFCAAVDAHFAQY